VTLSRLADTIVQAEGWWRILIAFLAGASSTLALPPTDIWPLPFITFPILVWLVVPARADSKWKLQGPLPFGGGGKGETVAEARARGVGEKPDS